MTSEVTFLYQPGSLSLRASVAPLYDGIVNIDSVQVYLKTGRALDIIYANWRISQEKSDMQDILFHPNKIVMKIWGGK